MNTIQEVIEEGRRSFKSRIREMTVPGRYRSATGFDVTFADKQQLPARARRDFLMHAPFEVRRIHLEHMMRQPIWRHAPAELRREAEEFLATEGRPAP